MMGTTCRDARKMAFALTAKSRSQSASLVSTRDCGACGAPALLTRMSSRPNCLTAMLIIAAASASRATSARQKAAAVPSSRATSAPASRQSTSTMRAPSWTKRRQIAAPNPEAPPVTTATLFASRMSFSARGELVEPRARPSTGSGRAWCRNARWPRLERPRRPLDNEYGARGRPNLLHGHAFSDFAEHQPTIGHVDHRELGDDHVDDFHPRERQSALGQDLVPAVPRRVLHRHDDAPDAGDEIHGAAHAFHHLAGDHPVREIARFVHLQRAEHRQIDVAAADHRERLRAVEVRAARNLCDRLLAGVDQI